MDTCVTLSAPLSAAWSSSARRELVEREPRQSRRRVGRGERALICADGRMGPGDWWGRCGRRMGGKGGVRVLSRRTNPVSIISFFTTSESFCMRPLYFAYTHRGTTTQVRVIGRPRLDSTGAP